MNRYPRIALLSAVILVALVLNGAFPQPAMADEVPPPPPDTSEPAPAEPPPADQPTEAPPADAVPTEAAPVASTEETEPAEVLEALPSQTGLVVLDANGQPMSLTSAEAALAIATGDPMWCPAGNSPGDSGCTGSFSNFNGPGGLLPYLVANNATFVGAGTIFVSVLYNTAGELGPIIINGLAGYGITDLTIQGGWDFGPDNKVVGTTTFDEALKIINWNHDVTLNDLIFNNTAQSENLLVETTGNIELYNVESRNNTGGAGATLDNTSGSGSIEVNSSSFHDNLTIGIQALSNNAISLNEVDAYDNGDSGAVLDNCQAALSCTATFAGSVYVSYSTFNHNDEDGLNVASNGYIQTIDITANENGQSGIVGSGMVLDNSLADDPQSVTVGYLYGNEFNDNLENGLTVLSKGDITVYQATANNNGHTSDWAGAGAYLNNTFGDADTFVYNYNIYTDQYGEFNGNYADGLSVRSNGNVELWYIRAEGNGNSGNAAPDWGMGTYIDNCNWDGFNCDGTGWVEVNHSDLNSNYSAGLYVYSGGQIDLTDVTANDNGNTGNTNPFWTAGAYLDNSDGIGGVTINSGEFGSYVAGGNYGDGLDVYSTGDVYVSYVYAYDNGNTGNTDTDFGNGAILDSCLENAGACAGTGYVYVFASEFNDNYTNGLSAFSSSNIWLNYYVEANDNGQSMTLGSGAMLVNNFTGATGSILLYGPITLNNNYTNGLVANSNSNIYMTGVEANDNGASGAVATTTNGSVTIDPSTFNSNDADGLIVSATDNVALTDVEASDNGGFGASLVTTAGSVSIDQGIFNSNTTFGLTASAADDVELAGINASDNGSFGASVTTSAGAISLDSGAFNSNTGFGLSLSAPDDIDLTDVQANDNGGFGAIVATSGGAASVAGGDFISNSGNGLSLSAVDDVSLSDMNASDNGGFGASVVTSAGGLDIDVGIFDSNAGFGLNASAVDRLVLNQVDANDNGGFGASLSSSSSDVFANHSNFDLNTGFGLTISAADEISMTEASASDNGGFGVSLSAAAGPVWIDTGSFNGNTTFGLNVGAMGDVTLANVSASDNGTFGAQIASSAGSVNIDPSYFNSNGSYGLGVSADDQIGLESVQANDNTSFGADLSSASGVLAIGDSAFDGNGGYGLFGAAPGAVNVWNTSASDNSVYGANLSSTGNISLLNSIFSQNTGGAGLTLTNNGNTNLQDVTASQNSSTGASIATGGKVNVDKGSFSSNSAAGLSVVANGDVRLNLVDAFSNSLAGASIVTGSNVFVNPSYFNWNGADGLNITAGESVLLAEVNASNNTGAGANVSAGGGITVNGGYFSNNGGDGLNLVSGGDIIIKCITALNNGGYGIDANLPGTLKTKDNTLADNSAGDMNIGGGGTLQASDRTCGGWPHWNTSGLPWQVFHVTTGDTQTLECTLHGGTVLILPNWDYVAIPCPITGDASLVTVPGDNLPGELGENYSFVSALDTQIKPAPDGEIRVDFLIPPEHLNTNLIIMHWDGTQWVDRGGALVNEGFFEITSREPGVFALVSQ